MPEQKGKRKRSPQKKLIGMVILFILIPVFILAYFVFVLDMKPGLDTIVILGAALLLILYFYRRYKKQLGAQQAEAQMAEPPEGEFGEGELPEGGLVEEELPEEELPAEPEPKAMQKKIRK